MGEVIFCKTNDGSVGLYNNKVEDIYHSTYGAYSESYEKFLEASNFLNYIIENDKVKILDICYGIGYNTKTALNEIIKLDKTMDIHIDALEYDKNLVNISPLLKHQKIDNCINAFLIMCSNINLSMPISQLINIFIKTEGVKYINWRNLSLLFARKILGSIKIPSKDMFAAFLHNIYYHYVSARSKKGLKSNKLEKTTITFHTDDARKSVLLLDKKYNFIFLDAFTPKKLPTLWTLEFFKVLFRLLDDDGVLITYSSSVAVRAAMIEAGFNVGRSIDQKGKNIGTVATKNPKLIKYKLEDVDLGLLKTTAGVFYRDENLTALPEAIIERREEEAKNSGRITSSRFKKTWNKTTI